MLSHIKKIILIIAAMELREALLKEHSKRQISLIVCWISDDQKRFDELIKLFMGSEYRVTQRASWVMGDCAELYPQLLKKHLAKLVANLNKPDLHDAVRRNTIRLLQFVKIPEKLEGMVLDICFKLLAKRDETIAVKVLSMTVLANIVKKYPELQPELIMLIEEQMQQPSATPAIIGRGKRTLETLAKNKKL